MKKFATTTPDPELNIPSPKDGDDQQSKSKPTGSKRPVDLDRLSREEDQQDDPTPPPDDG